MPAASLARPAVPPSVPAARPLPRWTDTYEEQGEEPPGRAAAVPHLPHASAAHRCPAPSGGTTGAAPAPCPPAPARPGLGGAAVCPGAPVRDSAGLRAPR